MVMVTTNKITEGSPEGLMDVKDLHKRTIVTEDENELTNVIEYWLGPVDEVRGPKIPVNFDGCELVHRSVHVQLKHNVAVFSKAAEVG